MARPTSTWRAALFSTSNSASPYSAAPTWTPAANSLIVCFVCTNATTAADPSSVSAHGVSLTKILGGITADAAHMLSIWVGDAGSSPTSAAASATVAGTPTGCVVDEFEVTNWGNSVSAVAAILQTNSGTGSAASGTVAVRLVPQTVNESGYLSFYIHVTNETSTGQGGNWTATAGGTGNYNTPATSAIGQHNNTGYTATATASWSTSSAYATIVIEVQGSTSATPSESLKIADTVTARLNPDPVNPGNEPVKVADTVLNAFTSTDLAVVAGPERARVLDWVYGATKRTGTDLSAGLLEITPLKLADGGVSTQQGIVSLIGTVHVVDQTPIVSMDAPSSSDLSATAGPEALKVQDSVTVFENPFFATVSAENVHVVDQLTQPTIPGILTVVVASESIRVMDWVLGASKVVGDLSAGLMENPYHVKDGGILTQQGIVQLLGVIHVVDGPVLADLGILQVQVPTEVVFVSEERFDLSTGLSELLHVQDQLTQPTGLEANDLSRNVGDENLKLADTLATFENPLQTSTPVESLKVQDAVTVLENPLFAPVTDEPVKVADSVTIFENPLFAAPAVEGLKVQDQTPPQVTRVDGSDLTPPLLTENVKVADTVTVSENPFFVAVGDEALKVQDAVTVVEDPLVAAPAVESLKVQDSISLLENPLFASILDEGLKVQDQTPPQASLTSANLLAATISPDEILHVQDSATLTLDPEQTTITAESLKISDAVTPALERSVTVTQEALKVQDTVTPALWLATSTPNESLKVQDSLSASLTVLRASPTVESLKVQDQVNIGVDLLSVNIASENLKVQDFWIVEGTADYVVVIPADDYVVVIPKDDDAVVMP